MSVVKCSNCKNKFKISIQRLKKNKHNSFCSKKCEGEYRKKICKTKIEVNCSICNNVLFLKKSEFNRRNKNGEITCSYECMGKLKKHKFTGRKNPNSKYSFDDDFFKNINSENKAYILGWIASDGSIRENGAITIEINNKDRYILEKIRDIICKDMPIVDDNIKKGNNSLIRFCSKTMVEDVCKLLKINRWKKDSIVRMPDIKNNLKWHFLRGFFDGDGSIRKKTKGRYLDCNLATHSEFMRKDIEYFCNIPCDNDNKWKQIRWYGKNAMLFLDMLYESATIFLERKYNMYVIWKTERGEGRFGSTDKK